jgi:hypothetical protein
VEYKGGIGSLVGFLELAGTPMQEGDETLMDNLISKRYPCQVSKPDGMTPGYDYREYKENILSLLSDNPQSQTRALRFWSDHTLEKGTSLSTFGIPLRFFDFLTIFVFLRCFFY